MLFFQLMTRHYELVTPRGKSFRVRQHTELWQTLRAPSEPESASRRRR